MASGNIKAVAGPAGEAVIVVKDGESIQAAVKRAVPGTTIQILPGTYHETVYIDKDNVRLIGVIDQGRRAVLDGEGKLNDAILYSGNNVVVENLTITKYKGNGIMGQAGNNFEIRNNLIVDTGVYGIFPQLGQNGVVEHNVVSGIEDAAIYVGMSDNVHVAHNDVFDSVAGIEIENSRHAIVENNYVHNNTGGILAFVTPGLPIKTTSDVIIRNNFIVGNNHDNFGAPGSTVAGIPPGTGVLVMAADDVVIEGNIISDNKTAGILVTDHGHAANITVDPESEPNSDRVKILDNVMRDNGYDTIPDVKALMLTELQAGQPRHRARRAQSRQLHPQPRALRHRRRQGFRELRLHQYRRHRNLPAAAGAGARDRARRARQDRLSRRLQRLSHLHRAHDRTAGADDPGAVHGQPAGHSRTTSRTR